MARVALRKSHTKVGSAQKNVEEHASAKRSSPVSVQTPPVPVENEEAHLTGAGSKEQQHRLLRQNVEEGKAERHPDLPAGLHSTGSFTSENEKKK